MSYIICFKNKAKIQVDEITGVKLKEAKANQTAETFEIENDLFSLSGIDMIVNKTNSFNYFPFDWELLKSMEDKKANISYLESSKLR